jgi:hypothetical protein
VGSKPTSSSNKLKEKNFMTKKELHDRLRELEDELDKLEQEIEQKRKEIRGLREILDESKAYVIENSKPIDVYC